MLGHGSDASDLCHICHIESLDATVVKDIPNFDHTFSICCDEAVEGRKTIDSNKGMLVTF